MSVLWLIGMMGSGKTAVGKAVADLSGLPLIDTDDRIENQMGHTIASLWDTAGEEAFRALESMQISQVVAEGIDCVVATGGGAILEQENRRLMRKNGLVVWLTAAIDVLSSRLAIDQTRPLLEGGSVTERLIEILDERTLAYTEAAHHQVETTARTPDEVAREVMQLWNAS